MTCPLPETLNPSLLGMVVGRCFLLSKDNILLMFVCLMLKLLVSPICPKCDSYSYCIYFTSNCGNGPVWLIFFSRVVQPPTTNVIWMATTIWMKSKNQNSMLLEAALPISLDIHKARWEGKKTYHLRSHGAGAEA